jgi:hypothetical protein
LVAASVLASCGGPDKLELTLRARDDDGTSFINLERQWLAADGRHATSPPRSGDPDLHEQKFGDAECGGEKWLRRLISRSGPEMESAEDSFELKLDDGDSATLDPQMAVRVADATGYQASMSCFEETGRWRGTAGDLLNHEGAFTVHYDSIQTVLHLVED